MQRRDKNRLSRLLDKDNVWVEGQSDIMLIIENYFKEIYSPSMEASHPECLSVIPNLVSSSMNEDLLAPVLGNEI